MKTNSLYIHIPFCLNICSYCDFCKVFYQEELANNYLNALHKELVSLQINHGLKTIYIGGGTPSSLSYEQLERLMVMIQSYINQDTIEVCIEVNPESMDSRKLEILKKAKINRLSIGVQTFNDDLLRQIDRKHNYQQVVSLIDEAIKVGIENISIDLMYGLPNQTLSDIKKDLDILKGLNVKHISYYSLILEDHTILKNHNYQELDDETEEIINEYIDKELLLMGYYKYEVSNYSKIGFESAHNLVYWHYDNYYGIGVGSSSKIDNFLIEHNRNVISYLNDNIKEIIELSNDEVVFNQVMMSLRLVKGIDCEMVKKRYGVDLIEKYHEVINKYQKLGMLKMENGHLSCTEKSIKFLNTILVDFMS